MNTTTYTGARPYEIADGARLYQYMEHVFAPGDLVPPNFYDEQTQDGWRPYDRYENSTGHYFVFRRELEINTMAIGFGDVVSVDEARGLETGRTVTKNEFLITRVIWESVEQIVDFIEKDKWTVIGAFHMYTSGDNSGHTEVIMIKFEDETPAYPHEKVIGQVQRVLAL